jgi:hypothetical protein
MPPVHRPFRGRARISFIAFGAYAHRDIGPTNPALSAVVFGYTKAANLASRLFVPWRRPAFQSTWPCMRSTFSARIGDTNLPSRCAFTQLKSVCSPLLRSAMPAIFWPCFLLERQRVRLSRRVYHFLFPLPAVIPQRRNAVLRPTSTF